MTRPTGRARMRLAVVALLALVALVATTSACERPAPPVDEKAELGGEAVARVGGTSLPASLVAKVATAQKVPPREALRRLVDDAVAAEAARSRGLDRESPASWRLTAARARFVTDRLLVEAKAAGPPNDAEIAELAAQYWREVDRPPAVRVVHALAMRPKTPDPAAEASARAVANAIHDAVASATSAEEFKAKAKAVAHPPEIQVVIEDLPAFADDGRVTEGGGAMVEPFAKGAFAIAQPGGTSGVVETQFGWHVIRLVERVPAQRMSTEDRRIAFTDAAYALRAEKSLAARVSALRVRAPVAVSPAAEQLMRSAFGGGGGSGGSGGGAASHGSAATPEPSSSPQFGAP